MIDCIRSREHSFVYEEYHKSEPSHYTDIKNGEKRICSKCGLVQTAYDVPELWWKDMGFAEDKELVASSFRKQAHAKHDAIQKRREDIIKTIRETIIPTNELVCTKDNKCAEETQ